MEYDINILATMFPDVSFTCVNGVLTFDDPANAPSPEEVEAKRAEYESLKEKESRNFDAQMEASLMADNPFLITEYQIVYDIAKEWKASGYADPVPTGIVDQADAELIIQKGDAYRLKMMQIRERRKGIVK